MQHDHESLLLHGFPTAHPEHHPHSNVDWVGITAMLASLVALFIVTTSPDHFLEKHLWEHIIKKHLFKIFLWTFGALLFIHFGLEFLHMENWIKDNLITILLFAVLVGIIPESGPHI
ncbi:hypothetical protein ACFLRI_05135, partial [Bacteroidota bacterium]